MTTFLSSGWGVNDVFVRAEKIEDWGKLFMQKWSFKQITKY